MEFGKDRQGHPVPQELLSLFEQTSVIKFDPNIQGQRIEEDWTIVVGARAAYQICATNLFHELGHFVEIDTRRMGQFGWGLGIKTKVVIMGQVYEEPTTHQITDREIRVMAMQANLSRHFGIEPDLHNLAEILQWLPDTAFLPIEDGSSAYGDDKNHNLEYGEIKESQNKWRIAQIKEQMKVYTTEFFFSEWERRIKILERRAKRRRSTQTKQMRVK